MDFRAPLAAGDHLECSHCGEVSDLMSEGHKSPGGNDASGFSMLTLWLWF